MIATITDAIERKVFLRASRKNVWDDITDPKLFAEWFSMDIKGTFEPGNKITGTVNFKEHEKMIVDAKIDEMVPQKVFSWYWHPFPADPNFDYSKEAMTHISFELKDSPGGTLLTVTESGFDKLSPSRRNETYNANSEGWDMVLKSIEKHFGEGE